MPGMHRDRVDGETGETAQAGGMVQKPEKSESVIQRTGSRSTDAAWKLNSSGVKAGESGKKGSGSKAGERGKKGSGAKAGESGKKGGGVKAGERGKKSSGAKAGENGKKSSGAKAGESGKKGGGVKAGERGKKSSGAEAGESGKKSGGMKAGGSGEKNSATGISRQRIIQLLAAALFNGYAVGFRKGKIFTGNSKALCVPVLNCYSCPGALGACPIGSLQASLSGFGRHFPFYVLGMLMLFGIVLGRLVCGLLCPFGLVQDLLHKIPVPKYRVPKVIDKPARYIKYAVFLVFVVVLPLFAVPEMGIAPPYFCKYLCPAGTLGGGIPLLTADPMLRQAAGVLFDWKLMVLAVILLSSMFIHRPFCRYLCPLGAFYSLFNRFSFYQMKLDSTRCIDCKKCEQSCPMAVEVTKNCNSPECIRCGKCREVCPTGAISSGFARKERETGKCRAAEETR